jgi:cobalt-zinc-cadmium efflux system protein
MHSHTGGRKAAPADGRDSAGGRDDGARGLGIALAITLCVMLVEFVGGLLSNSLALLADAGHMLTDAAALALSYFAIWFSSRPATAQKTYGFHRVEILAALLNGILLAVVALFVLREAYGRLLAPPEVEAGLMLVVASGGLVANLTSAWLLYRSQSESLNVRGAFLHVLSDAAGSVGAIVAGLAILLFEWRAADAAVSIVVVALILSSSWVLIRDAVDILLEGTPPHIDLETLKGQIVGASGVRSVHDLHVWTLTSGLVAMSCHVVVDPSASQPEVLMRVSGIAQDRFRIDHATIQVEPHGPGGRPLGECICQFGAR